MRVRINVSIVMDVPDYAHAGGVIDDSLTALNARLQPENAHRIGVAAVTGFDQGKDCGAARMDRAFYGNGDQSEVEYANAGQAMPSTPFGI